MPEWIPIASRRQTRHRRAIDASDSIGRHARPRRYLGVWTFIYLVGYSLGPLLGGMVLEALGARGAYLVVACTGLGGAALLVALSAAYRLRARRPSRVTVG